MAGVFKLEIIETVDELKTLLNEQKTVEGHERVQALYGRVPDRLVEYNE